jgi:2-dehydro-3-deoxygalactonokinase
MKKFLSCDWGTTSFRLRLVEIAGEKIIAEKNSNEGIAKVFDLWKQAGKTEDRRFSFYLDRISQCIGSIEKTLDYSLDGFPLVISGMACSTMGMIDLPYKGVPFSADGSDLITEFTEANNEFNHDIIFISGARTENDAMRGEETQLVGCGPDEQEQLFIFPGTHSKHVTVRDRKAVGIKTYMTGEFFALLSEKSILSAGIEGVSDLETDKINKSFQAGVKESLHSNLLNSSFKIRTNDLFQKLSRGENYHYLSGLLIGTEMKELVGVDYNVILVSNSPLHSHYESAYHLVMNKTKTLKIQNADEAMVVGQLKILNRLLREKRFSDAV